MVQLGAHGGARRVMVAACMVQSDFVFVACQRGAEQALKREVARRYPAWRAAYQRPGVLTFKVPQALGLEASVDLVLARTWGLSLGTVAGASAVRERIAMLSPPLRLHVFERELHRPDEAPPWYVQGALSERARSELLTELPDALLPEEEARVDETVLDVIVAEGDPWLLGVHRHTRRRSPWPGGRYVYEVPADAPSRAYRKIEEAIAAFDLPMRAGDMAVELGAAPGGAAYALVRRGLSVTAIDPADMDPRVMALEGPGGAAVTHLRSPMAEVGREQLPREAQWLLMDVHLAPQVALRAASRFASMYKRSLLGVVFTLKLNDWAFLERLDSFVEQVREMGVLKPRVRQLPAHRQEIVVVALTRLGDARRRA